MNWNTPNLNLVLAWLWIGLGFVSGALLGLGFARENWLGGYTSLRRRMYRLGHISFLGLGIMNLLFFFTVSGLDNLPSLPLALASWSFIIGALTMPISCLAQAHHLNTKPQVLFAVPVTSLLIGGISTVWMLLPL